MNTSPYFFPASLFPLADSLSSGILLHRGERILFANKAMSRLTGFSPDELADKDFWAFFPPGVSSTIRNQGRERLQGEHLAVRYETVIITKTGEDRWVELAVCQEDIQGERTIVCNFIDVTERKRAEAAQNRNRHSNC